MTLIEELKKHRRALHQIPELGFEENKTQAYLIQHLEEAGLEVKTVAKTGVLALLKGPKPGRTLAFRADMDGLPVNEKNHLVFASTHPGQMHACGHDGHMALVLTLARRLAAIKDHLVGDLVFLFQPAEEGPGGAKVIEDEGLLDVHRVDEILGLHLMPDLPQGTIGLKSGAMMAMTGEFDLTVRGQSAHGAKPHQGRDALVASADLLLGLQTIVARRIDPMDPAVLTVGRWTGGERRNILAREAVLEGTMRAFDRRVYQAVKEAVYGSARAIKERYQVEVEVVFRDMYPPVTNDEAMCRAFFEALGERAQTIKPVMLAEDFSYYQEKRPGLFFFLGVGSDRYTSPLHSATFDFDEEALLLGMEAYVLYLEKVGILTEEVRAHVLT